MSFHMKHIVLLVSLVSLILSGCTNSNEPTETMDELQKVIDITNYKNVVYENRGLISDWAYAKQDAQEEGTRAAYAEEAECFTKIKHNLLPSATQFAADLEISKEDIESMTEVPINNNEEYEDALIGVMLFMTMTNCSLIDDDSLTRGKSLVDCFLEATGIAAGVELVAHMSKSTMSKAAVKSTLKIIAKVGTKTLNGIGLTLMAAEIIWCMW